MAYTLNFSDPSKTSTVIVPDMPPGINTIDTSLSLVGRGYPNYGEKIAENFLHLIENFASAIPPENPIEGQLWYDTSDPNNKVLRVMDGTVDNTRWPNATGIYQQNTDPRNSATAGLKKGDIWVDTLSNQLKIYNSNSWTIVGPSIASGGSKTGPEAAYLESSTSTLTTTYTYPVIKNYVGGDVVSIIANHSFTPKIAIDGFTTIRPGVTVSSLKSGRFNSTAVSALSLEISNQRYSSSEFLRKNDRTVSGQVISGIISFSTAADQNGAQGRDGIVINVTGSSALDYIQFYKAGNDAVILNNKAGGKIVFKTKPTPSSSLITALTIENRTVAINTSTSASSPSLDVYGDVRISSTLTVLSTSSVAVKISGSMVVDQDSSINRNLLVTGITTATGTLYLGSQTGSGVAIQPKKAGTYDIGTPTYPFNRIYASVIGAPGTQIYGQLVGEAYFPPGMITAFGSTSPPPGWLLCDGSTYSATDETYAGLYAVIGTTYGGAPGDTFDLPNMQTSTSASGGFPVSYIIKI